MQLLRAAAPRSQVPQTSPRFCSPPPPSGLLLSAGTGLFGYQESLAVPYAETSLAVEFTGAVVLMVAAVIALLATRRSRGQSF